MSRVALPPGEVAVVGLGRSGAAVTRLLVREGRTVYASDASTTGHDAIAAELRALGVTVDVGGHDLERIARAGIVVTSPGIKPSAPPLATATKAGVPIVSEVEVALGALPNTRAIATTGTNGKSTVTALIDHLLRALGQSSVAAGNIGTALSEVALMERHPDWVALELSSYQLHDTPSIAPTVGVLTNLAPDHLDRYASLEAYYRDKDLLFRNATVESNWVTNADDAEVQRRTAHVAGNHFRFSLKDPAQDASAGAHVARCSLLGHPFVRRDEIPLLGDHNVANVLAAALAVASADLRFTTPDAIDRLIAGVRSFRGMPHRMEQVGVRDGVLWINDSKATNVSSALVAIAGMTRPTILLLGGKHKGEPYTPLIAPLKRHGKMVLAYGEAAALIEHDLAGHVPLERLGSSFDEVMARARTLAVPGDAVLLSPACSSFDMFTDYEDRGATFRRLALHA